MRSKGYLRLGLTGGVASGKSTAAQFFADLGCGVIDADRASREVVEPGSEGLDEIRKTFGAGVLRPDGALSRDAMRRLVFLHPEKRLLLEAIVHPLVYRRVMEALDAFEREGRPAGLVEAALLLENPAPFDFDAIIAVVCGKEIQTGRLRKRDGWSDEEIQGVLEAQMTDLEREEKADHVLRNFGGFEDLRAGVEELWKKLREG